LAQSLCTTLLLACSGGTDGALEPAPEVPGVVGDARSGGAMTVSDATSRAFGQPASQLTGTRLARFTEGDAAFDAAFVPAPAPVNPGLGPRFDNTRCGGCHVNDGRGQPPRVGEQFASMLFKISIPGTSPDGSPSPVPGFGRQLTSRASVGLIPMGRVDISYLERGGSFGDGTAYSLRAPTYSVRESFRALPATLLLSPRVAPQNFGLGLLEAVPADSIQAVAARQLNDPDGVRGHPNRVWDVVTRSIALGRFGLKAGAPTLRQQAAAAYQGDMGITNSLFPDEACDDPIPGCAPHAAEVSDETLRAVEHYLQTLAVPARRGVRETAVVRGEAVFRDLRCTTCHVETLVTGVVTDAPERSQQRIHAYTDLLLHDMGEALADNRPEFMATGRDWRTPPLWGIGLSALVNGHTTFLHDGRARSLTEAILWHDGEALKARERFRLLPQSDRDAVVAFLNSL
jgi:CxxC motif-containing protein (DUF1111 family)